MREHWRVTLEGYPDNRLGDVFTKDGEIIGTWSVDDEEGWFSFVPDGDDTPMFTDLMLGLFCFKIAEWHDARVQAPQSFSPENAQAPFESEDGS